MEQREAAATGEPCMRVDAVAKATGRARYTDDYVMGYVLRQICSQPNRPWLRH